MPRAAYRDRAQTVEVGDFVRGWADAGATEEVAGVVVSVHPDLVYGSNVVLAVLDHDVLPNGAEADPDELMPGEVLTKDHQGRANVLTLRTIEAHADRLELVYRRKPREGYRGVLRQPDAQAREQRAREQESRRRQMEATQFVPPRDSTPAAPQISGPPQPLPPPREGDEHAPPPLTPPAGPPKKDESKGKK